MNYIYTLLFLLLSALPIFAQTGAYGGSKVFDGYYDNANGLKKASLKTAMHNIISKANVLGYGSGAGRTWSGFYQTDRYEDNRVRDRYSYDVRYFPSTASAHDARAVNGMNIEHSFPKSWWGGAENQAYKDLFNLMPCESSINSSKSNYPMGKVLSDEHGNGCTKVGKGKAGSETTMLWEPADEWKGDFARSYFYMVTAYSNLTWAGTQASLILQNDEWPTLKEWAYTLFLEWCRQDPVDEIEVTRNEVVYGIQGNRNPFIDFPNLAEYIWGDSINVAFSVDGSTIPVDPDDPPVNPIADILAYDATEIVSSIYSCRFDANWGKYKEGTVYTLDVYTKDTSGNRSSLPGYPVKTGDCSYRVSDGVKANTTYYYNVVVYGNDGEVVARSSEVEVEIPSVSPVFTVAPSLLSFSSTPGVASLPSKVSVTLMATETKVTTVQVEGAFEVAMQEDAREWRQGLILTGANVVFYVRLAAQGEGDVRGNLLVSTQGVETRVIPLLGSVDSQKAFFEGFETGSKAAYDKDNNEVECTMGRWRLKNALLGNADSDTFNGTKSIRMKAEGCVEMLFDKMLGCDSLWFYSGLYYKDKGVTLDVSYSLDQGETWNAVVTSLAVGDWRRYGFAIHEPGMVRVKFEAKGTSGKRLHIDDIQMNDYREEVDAIVVPRRGKTPGDVWYNLQGERVSAPSRHGIYLLNGKKIVR